MAKIVEGLERLLAKAGIGGQVAATLHAVNEAGDDKAPASSQPAAAPRPRGHGASSDEVRRVSSSF